MCGMWRGFNGGKAICNTFPVWDYQYQTLMTIKWFHLWVKVLKKLMQTWWTTVAQTAKMCWPFTPAQSFSLFGHSLCVCRRITVCGLRSWATATTACRGCPRPVPTMRTAAWRWVWTWSKQSREYYSVASVHQTGTARLLCLVLNASRETQKRRYGEAGPDTFHEYRHTLMSQTNLSLLS